MAKLFRSKEVNGHLDKEINRDLANLRENGINPLLVGIRLGNNPADISYEKAIIRKFEKFDLGYRSLVWPDDKDDDFIIEEIYKLSKDPEVNGILIFQPLSQGHDIWRIREALPAIKDVDGLGLSNLGKIMAGRRDGFSSSSAMAVIELLDYYGIDLEGKDVVIIGRGLVVGRPLTMLLCSRSATVTLCHSGSRLLEDKAKSADIIVSATGQFGLIDERYVKEGQILIDLGAGYKDGKIAGDIDADSVKDIVEAYTPVPGGVGGITVNVLIRQLLKATRLQNKI